MSGRGIQWRRLFSLETLVWLTIVVPALAIGWGGRGSRMSFVLYREPKLIAVSCMGWILVTAFVWQWRRSPPTGYLVAILRRPAVVALGIFLAYMITSGLWVRVAENHFYEVNQYLLLFSLLVILLVAMARDPSLHQTVQQGLVASLALVTLVALLQRFEVIPWLAPIDPAIGVAHPSLMGYKNPAALALLGQMFLLAEMATDRRRTRWPRLGWSSLWVVELGYLLSLRSRTSYGAFAGGLVVLLVLWIARHSGARERRGALVLALLVVMLSGGIALFHGPARERLTSTLSFVQAPSTFLQSDRGVYLLNTLNMARHRPFGVGLGDWQTHYPLYRLHDRFRAFDENFEVRRAHSDHVQILGEGGWPGLVSWLAFLCILLVSTASQPDRRRACFETAQLVALVLAMGTDYVLDLPYSKFQFFCLLAVALFRPSAKASVVADEPRPRTDRRYLVAAGLLAVVTAGQLFYHWQLSRRMVSAATIESLYYGLEPTQKTETLRLIVSEGRRLDRSAGHTKSLSRAWLILGESARLVGEDSLAYSATLHGLQLSPYSPSALKAMARVSKGPERKHWLGLYEFVYREATHGFRGPYVPP